MLNDGEQQSIQKKKLRLSFLSNGIVDYVETVLTVNIVLLIILSNVSKTSHDTPIPQRGASVF